MKADVLKNAVKAGLEQKVLIVDGAPLETDHFNFNINEPTPEQIEAMKSALQMLPKAAVKPQPASQPVPHTIGLWSEFPESMKKSADLVPLRQATQMYQPVHGTSAGSRYFVVAANADLRVAARLQGQTLSVRIEGKGWDKYKEKMTAVGFSKVNANKQYASLHLDVGYDKVMASKTLGAVLMGLGIPMDTPLPDLQKVPKG